MVTVYIAFIVIVALVGFIASILEGRPGRKYVIAVGGGIASTVLLPLLAIAKYGYRNIELFMSYLPNEHPDVLRLVRAMEVITGKQVTIIGSGKTPFDIFHEVKRLGNSQIAPCSHKLKQDEALQYLETNYDQDNTTLLVGIGYYEKHRMIDISANWTRKGWHVEAPMIDLPEWTKEACMMLCLHMVGWIPELYLLGFEHNNCHGGCVRSGKGGWARLLHYFPNEYMRIEQAELDWQVINGNFTILRDERKNGTFPLTLREHRQRMEAKWAVLKPGQDRFKPPFIAPHENEQGCKSCEAI
jgi:3'-phosphoadenosine 5'-phosphosulfate sulfotransferase (PAPS reductase)/FAD synthetase